MQLKCVMRGVATIMCWYDDRRGRALMYRKFSVAHHEPCTASSCEHMFGCMICLNRVRMCAGGITKQFIKMILCLQIHYASVANCTESCATKLNNDLFSSNFRKN